MIKVPKRRSCKVCKCSFKPEKITDWGCCPEHQEEYAISLIQKVRDSRIRSAEKQAAKIRTERRVEKARRKERLKPSGKLAHEAQAAVNAYIRVRDYGKDCISCGAWLDHDSVGMNRENQVNAGHFRSVGAAPQLRFCVFNIHAQCIQCNLHLSGNRPGYDERLPARIGLDKFEMLTNNNSYRKYDDEYLIRIKRIFRKRARHLEKIRSRIWVATMN